MIFRAPNVLFTIIFLGTQVLTQFYISIRELESYPRLPHENDPYILKETTRATAVSIITTALLHFSLTALFPFSLIDVMPLSTPLGSYQGSQPAAVFSVGQGTYFKTGEQSGFAYFLVVISLIAFPWTATAAFYNIFGPVTKCLNTGLGWVGSYTLQPLIHLCTPAWKSLRSSAKSLWNNDQKPGNHQLLNLDSSHSLQDVESQPR